MHLIRGRWGVERKRLVRSTEMRDKLLSLVVVQHSVGVRYLMNWRMYLQSPGKGREMLLMS